MCLNMKLTVSQWRGSGTQSHYMPGPLKPMDICGCTALPQQAEAHVCDQLGLADAFARKRLLRAVLRMVNRSESPLAQHLLKQTECLLSCGDLPMGVLHARTFHGLPYILATTTSSAQLLLASTVRLSNKVHREALYHTLPSLYSSVSLVDLLLCLSSTHAAIPALPAQTARGAPRPAERALQHRRLAKAGPL